MANAYELRHEMFSQAREHLSDKYHAEVSALSDRYHALVGTDRAEPYPVWPAFPSFEDIEKFANKAKGFVDG